MTSTTTTPQVAPQDVQPVEARAHALLAQVADQVGLPIPDLIVDPGPYDNAGVGLRAGRPALRLDAGLLRRPDEQVRAVIAHELGHIAHRHHRALDTVTWVLLSMLAASGSLLVTVPMHASAVLSLGLFDAALAVPLFLAPAIARRHERVADAFATRHGHGPALLEVLSSDRSTERSGLATLWRVPFRSHPTQRARVRILTRPATTI